MKCRKLLATFLVTLPIYAAEPDGMGIEGAKQWLREAGHSEEAIREAEVTVKARIDDVVASMDIGAIVAAVPAQAKQAFALSTDRSSEMRWRAQNEVPIARGRLVDQGFDERRIGEAVRQARGLSRSIRDQINEGERPLDVFNSFGATEVRLFDFRHSGPSLLETPECVMTKAVAATDWATCEARAESSFQRCILATTRTCQLDDEVECDYAQCDTVRVSPEGPCQLQSSMLLEASQCVL
ncbi:MAG: hypothetical protein OXI79_12340 [Gammaproteobacteria bacterium]|nr:hypothetical protein [Gammaproteobacteria bacterium]